MFGYQAFQTKKTSLENWKNNFFNFEFFQIKKKILMGRTPIYDERKLSTKVHPNRKSSSSISRFDMDQMTPLFYSETSFVNFLTLV